MSVDKGPHYPLIQQRLPTWLSGTAWHRAQALAQAPLTLIPELIAKPALDHGATKAANAHAWAMQNRVDQRLKDLQDLQRFAAPLLTQRIKERHGLDLDVRATHLFLHTRKGTVLKGTTSRTVSLLEAALQNFSSGERFTASSSYITQPDALGHFTIEPFKDRMSIEQFIGLCRELDVGASYQRHLQQHLLPVEEAARAALQADVIANQQAALSAAAHLAQLRGQLDTATFHLLQRVVRGERGTLQFYRLRMMDSVLTGILLIAADLDQATHVVPVLAYIPHDPGGPIQPYPSTLALRDALLKKLQEDDYRRFFSQFIDQQQRGHFFSGLQQHLRLSVERIDGELWPQLYQQALNKILNDARQLAVPTADADSQARWAWWDNASKILGEILNAALLVATPFVPLLGEAMLAYTAWQLLDEVVEGAVDLAEGQAREAAEHLLGVLSDVVQLAAFGVGGKLAQSAFVNQLKAVQINRQQRLWNPDPRPYRQQGVNLAPDAVPDERGLHRHDGQTILPLDGDHYALDFADGEHRIRHATRPAAYAPPLRYIDSPRARNAQQQLRALGPFSDEKLEQIRTTCGLDPDQLRAIQTDRQPAPILTDVLKRCRLYEQARDLPEHLRRGEPVDQDTYWSPTMAMELPGWPADHAILVYETEDLSGSPARFGQEAAAHTLAISRQDLNLGRLSERLVDWLDSVSLQAVLEDLPTDRAARITALRERLADTFASRQGPVFDYLYRNSEHPASAHAVWVRQAFAELPQSAVQQVLAQARPQELAVMTTEHRLPLRLKNLARELQLQARAAQAFLGFYEPELMDAGTEQMVLGALRVYSDTFADSRIEVRRHTLRASLRASAGPLDARYKRVLLRTDGHYQLYDDRQQLLLPQSEFYEALLHALPAAKRTALGFNPTEGTRLKEWVLDKLRPPEQRRALLAAPESESIPSKDAQVLVQKPMFPVPQWVSQLFPPNLESRVKALYPYATRVEVEAYLATLVDPLQRARFEARELENANLQTDLTHWVNAGPLDEPTHIVQRRMDFANTLLRSWEQNIDPSPEGIGLSLNGVRLGGLLDTMRLRADFSHVLHLDLINADLLDTDAGILAYFPRLVSLNLSDNLLNELPSAVSQMTSLSHLALEGNPIRWDAAHLSRISQLRNLRHLTLANNRNLTQAPHLGRMPALRSLSLRNTGISEWPDGLFDQSRPAGFFLDVQNTAIDHVPQFLPWQPEAELVARVRLDRNHLTAQAEQQLISYRLAAGLDPYRSYPPQGDAEFWLEQEKEHQQPWLGQIWDELEAEHGSQGFFEVIKSLEPPAFFEEPIDAERYQRGRRELTNKVWRMLLAMERDGALRTQLFSLASNPVTCADAGAHTFNAMGVEVQLAEINHERRGLLREVYLAQLARGKARLEQLNHVAQADIRQRIAPVEQGGQGQRFSSQIIDGVPGQVDEVEVYLAYQSGLKSRLDLPWVSEHMTYRATANVDEARLENAYERVIGLEAGDGLVDAMLQQPFWDTYLRDRHASRFHASLEQAGDLIGPLDDLMFAQNEWSTATPSEREALKPRLLTLADALKVPHSEVLVGKPMTTQTYERLLAERFTQDRPSEQTLARHLTREALQHLSEYESGRGTPMEDKRR